MTTAEPRSVLVIGSGIIGLSAAWLLQRSGHDVHLIGDQAGGLGPGESRGDHRSGSGAALGVLMAQVFHRASGRAWRLRQSSLVLWQQWRQELAQRGCPIPYQPGLLLLAHDQDQRERLRRLSEARRSQGLPLNWWEPSRLTALEPALPAGVLGALHSAADGQLDPLAALAAFRRDGLSRGLTVLNDRATALERRSRGWRVSTHGGRTLEAEWVVVAAGLASDHLVQPLGHARPLEPVLGQCLELEAPEPLDWPCTLVWRGLNLVPRAGARLWLGATLEPGDQADPAQLAALRHLDGAAPGWLREARLVHRWQGLRARPQGRAAPVLEALEPGLLLLSGHYRNGVLLAPASALWALEQIETASAGSSLLAP